MPTPTAPTTGKELDRAARKLARARDAEARALADALDAAAAALEAGELGERAAADRLGISRDVIRKRLGKERRDRAAG